MSGASPVVELAEHQEPANPLLRGEKKDLY